MHTNKAPTRAGADSGRCLNFEAVKNCSTTQPTYYLEARSEGRGRQGDKDKEGIKKIEGRKEIRRRETGLCCGKRVDKKCGEND